MAGPRTSISCVITSMTPALFFHATAAPTVTTDSLAVLAAIPRLVSVCGARISVGVGTNVPDT